MLYAHVVKSIANFLDVTLGLFDRRAPVPLPLPPEDIRLKLGVPPLLFFHILTQLALVLVEVCFEDELQAARLACAVLFRALLTEMPE